MFYWTTVSDFFYVCEGSLKMELTLQRYQVLRLLNFWLLFQAMFFGLDCIVCSKNRKIMQKASFFIKILKLLLVWNKWMAHFPPILEHCFYTKVFVKRVTWVSRYSLIVFFPSVKSTLTNKITWRLDKSQFNSNHVLKTIVPI